MTLICFRIERNYHWSNVHWTIWQDRREVLLGRVTGKSDWCVIIIITTVPVTSGFAFITAMVCVYCYASYDLIGVRVKNFEIQSPANAISRILKMKLFLFQVPHLPTSYGHVWPSLRFNSAWIRCYIQVIYGDQWPARRAKTRNAGWYTQQV